MEILHYSEFDKRYDELIAHPDGVEAFRDVVLTPDEFADAFRRIAKDFQIEMEKRGKKVPASTTDVEKYDIVGLRHVQRHRAQKYTWGMFEELMNDWLVEQTRQMDE